MFLHACGDTNFEDMKEFMSQQKTHMLSQRTILLAKAGREADAKNKATFVQGSV